MTTFPELRAMMAKHGLDHTEMGELIGNTRLTFGKKLRGESEFTFYDMVKIKNYFQEQGEAVSIDSLFFNWNFTKVNEG